MAERNKATLIKKTPRCSNCSRNKHSKTDAPVGFIGNINRATSLMDILRRNQEGDKGQTPQRSDEAPSVSTRAPAQGVEKPKDDSGASSVVGSAAGGAIGAKAIAPGASTAAGTTAPSLLNRAGRFLGRAGIGGLSALGTYFGAKGIEELMDYAVSAPAQLKPGVRNSLHNVMVSEYRIHNLQKLLSRMSNLSSHVDNNGMKLGSIIGKTIKEIEIAKKDLINKQVK